MLPGCGLAGTGWWCILRTTLLFLSSKDLYTAPDSCKERCEEPYNENDKCHCNAECEMYHNCCEDYYRHCQPGEHPWVMGGDPEAAREQLWDTKGLVTSMCPPVLMCICVGGPGQPPAHLSITLTFFSFLLCAGGEWAKEAAHTREGFSSRQDTITDEDLLHISEQLYQADHNKAQPTDITIKPQYQASPDETGDQEDRSPQPLYKYVNEKLFSKPTYASFIKLLDNYQRATGREEDVTAEELREQDSFLKEVMKTELMKKLFTFLHEKNRYGSKQEFVADLKEMWFGLYSRGDGERDSSGFEHVFSGEVKKGKVSGFHNWIRFYLLEKQGIINYFSHNFNGPWDTYPDVLGLQFSWDGFYKEVGSAFIGCSPEFEFGLYTLCFVARPGKACHLSLGGYSISIQTYAWTKSTYSNGKKYIATAYVISP
ncbi:uridylate-specific endoribonuclease isoform X1 [Falco cherrug]|uniref:uridylate-specific endoribonuclease isoform X1 n=1 Tax=Falco cherrug TaxID=345164 RepID=UPI002479199E|nr:uridylate-specific endoribonuclease isoform X1 [Falco cherrug]XP_055648205.1 uridylate-specific endoribonuclease isoform X1 [Falco peregrinus]